MATLGAFRGAVLPFRGDSSLDELGSRSVWPRTGVRDSSRVALWLPARLAQTPEDISALSPLFIFFFFFCSFSFLETFRHLVREEVYHWRRAKWPRANRRSILALNGAFLPCISPRKNGDASRSRSWAAPSSSWAAAGRLLAARVRWNGSRCRAGRGGGRGRFAAQGRPAPTSGTRSRDPMPRAVRGASCRGPAVAWPAASVRSSAGGSVFTAFTHPAQVLVMRGGHVP